MKYHKIRGVDLAVCTAEQKIAYNLAFANYDIVLHSGRFANLAEAAQWIVSLYKSSYSYVPGKFDIDAIFCALNAGLESYCKKPFIASNYEEIGNAFPAHYLKTA